MTRVEAAIDALRDALEQERRAITAGRLDMILRLAEHREALMRDLGAATADSGVAELALAGLRADIERNQTMLAAAAKGIKSVVERIADIRANAGRLTIYGADGARQEHLRASAQPHKLERKA